MNAPTIYLTDKHTGLLVGIDHADPDPLEEGNWLIPAHAYLETPPEISEFESVKWENGGWVVVVNNRVIEIERHWRNLELFRSDFEINKIEDDDPKAVGTIEQWRKYRRQLRAWPEHEDFPSIEKRPIAPDDILEN